LTVKSSPSSGYNRSSYLKFSLANISNVSSAKLRIYGHNHENTETINLSVYGIDNDTWTETGINWNNAPVTSSAALAVMGINVIKYYEIDVTNFVQTQLAGDKIVSFLLKDATIQNTAMQFNSKENSQNKPELNITSSTAVAANQSLNYNSDIFSSNSGIAAENEMKIKVMPNPSQNGFKLMVHSKISKDVVYLRIMDLNGRVIELQRIIPGQMSTVGVKYKPGIYVAEFLQGNKRKMLKLIRL